MRVSRPQSLSVHPHTRGEYGTGTCGLKFRAGSPPHAWGIPKDELRHPRRSRFTPTRVGNTISFPSRCDFLPVHPHTRGEYGRRRRLSWGGLRFTPTRVGNTRRAGRRAVREPVHPHTRGEYQPMSACNKAPIGSPPHAWGIHFRLQVVARRARFTPTRVGNTFALSPSVRICTVHPHTRGEYSLNLCTAIGASGSPPHAWGILDYMVLRLE